MFSNFQKKFTFVFRLQEPWNPGTLEPWNPADLEPWTGEPTWGAYLGSLLGEPTCAPNMKSRRSLQSFRMVDHVGRSYHDGTLMMGPGNPGGEPRKPRGRMGFPGRTRMMGPAWDQGTQRGNPGGTQRGNPGGDGRFQAPGPAWPWWSWWSVAWMRP